MWHDSGTDPSRLMMVGARVRAGTPTARARLVLDVPHRSAAEALLGAADATSQR